MDDDGAMDIDDMDIDLGTDENVAALEAEALQLEFQTNTNHALPSNREPITGISDPSLQEEKVHIRGLDNLTTDDIKFFASEHFFPELTKIEWIDDTSANIQYSSAELSMQALASFTDPAKADTTSLEAAQLRRAKKLSTHPHVELNVRIALISDVKKPRAREASRFYLMNPDQDPGDRRQRSDNRQRGGGRGGTGRRDSRSRDEEKAAPFDVNLYDDDPTSLAARINRPRPARVQSRSRSRDVSDDQGRRRRSDYGRTPDLLVRPSKDNAGRLGRDRSASPAGEGDGRYGFDEIETRGGSFRRRSSSLPRRSNGSANAGKELIGFVAPSQSNGSLASLSTAAGKELFPNRTSPVEPIVKELFPTKTSTTGHRRKAAMDAADGHGADLFADRLAGPRLDSSSGLPRSQNLADRITGNGVRANGTAGAALDLASRINGGPKTLEGFSIRGTANSNVSVGFSIRGAAGLNNPRVKELFPDRTEKNEGKELFEGRIKGRGAQRRRAEDMFS